MIDFNNFLNQPKSLLIAPAGFGKTHTITTSVSKLIESNKKQLILTHTHAGVASIQEKFKKQGITTKHFQVETISSFSQRYVLSYNHKTVVPPIENSKEYYKFILDNSILLFQSIIIRKVLSSTYSGLFVDEYQDCTKSQHQLILSIAKILPTRILGDFLQGIFEFNEPIVNLLDDVEMEGFNLNKFALNEPQRWLNGNNKKLGYNIKEIREKLINDEAIDLQKFDSIEYYKYPESDLYTFNSDYKKLIWNIIKSSKELLILHDNTTSIEPRKRIVQSFKNQIQLIESIDDRAFYKGARILDEIDYKNTEKKLLEISNLLFNKTEIQKWFNPKGLKQKKKTDDAKRVEHLKVLVNEYNYSNKNSILYNILTEISNLPAFKCYRPEVLKSIQGALIISDMEKITLYEAMIIQRNKIRRYGRKITGKCIGTTLLTKGLEFDNVLILNAHKFNCPKHLYVAMTRACKRLIIVSESEILRPYQLKSSS